MSLSNQTTEMGVEPGGNGRRVQYGQFQFNSTDASGSLKVNLSKIDTFDPKPTGTVAADEQVTGPQIPLGGLVVDSTGTITVTRTGAAKTNGLICCYRIVGWCLLLGLLLTGVGCASVQKAADGAVGWLDAPASGKPASTQKTADGTPVPAGPTREQVVHVVLDTAAAASAGTPAGPVFLGLGGLFTVGGLVLRALSSKDHGTLKQKIDDVADAVQLATDHVQVIADAVGGDKRPPPPPTDAPPK